MRQDRPQPATVTPYDSQGGGRIGEGCTFGARCVLKHGATLTAHTSMGDDCKIGPYAVCIGPPPGASLGDRVTVGAGAKIWPGVMVCDDVEIGADSHVKEDITEPGVYVGQGRRLRKIR